MKIVELCGPDTSVPFPIIDDGGRERVIEWISGEMAKNHDLSLIGQKGSALNNVNIIEVDHIDGLNPANLLRAYKKLNLNIECDILHLHHPSYVIFNEVINAKKTVLTHHGLYTNKFNKPHGLVETYVSTYLKALMSNSGYTVYNPIPKDKYPLFKGQKGQFLLFIGACDKKVKRLDIAIELSCKLKAELIVAGPASKELQKEMSCHHYVSYIGIVSQLKKLELLQKAKAVICPNDAPEAFCLVAAESNAVGTPVLSSNNGGLPEVVEHGVSGFVCDSFEKYVESYNKIESLHPKQIRDSCLKKFGIKTICNDYIQLFNKIQ